MSERTWVDEAVYTTPREFGEFEEIFVDQRFPPTHLAKPIDRAEDLPSPPGKYQWLGDHTIGGLLTQKIDREVPPEILDAAHYCMKIASMAERDFSNRSALDLVDGDKVKTYTQINSMIFLEKKEPVIPALRNSRRLALESWLSAAENSSSKDMAIRNLRLELDDCVTILNDKKNKLRELLRRKKNPTVDQALVEKIISETGWKLDVNDMGSSYIAFITNNIVLTEMDASVPLGKFIVRLLSVGRVEVYPHSGNVSSYNAHPYLSSGGGELCYGAEKHRYMKAKEAKDFLAMALITKEVLMNYHENSTPYATPIEIAAHGKAPGGGKYPWQTTPEMIKALADFEDGSDESWTCPSCGYENEFFGRCGGEEYDEDGDPIGQCMEEYNG